MNKKNLIFILIIISLILSSCKFEKYKVSNTINSPKVLKNPLEGEWLIEEQKIIPTINLEKEEDLVGESVYIKDETILIGDYFIEDINYSTKNVNAEDYLLYKYKLEPDFLRINNDRISILTIKSEDQFVLDIIMIDIDKAIVYENNKFLYINKISDQIDSKKMNIEDNRKMTSLEDPIDFSKESSRSGILLGLKERIIEDNIEKWEYRTVYIKIDDLKDIKIYEKEGILLPRKNGFYDVKIDRKIEDLISFDDISIKSKDNIEDLQIHDSNFLKEILYIGNDYISLENTNHMGEKTLRVYPLDYLNEDKNLLLSEALDKETINRIWKDIKIKETEKTKIYFDEKDFGLMRRNGYWILVGNVKYKLNGEKKKEDYNIRAVTPNSIVNYDELSIPWSYIKTKVPDLVDAFTSPNGDILIVQTYNKIKGYHISNNIIMDKEIFNIEINTRESIIMNEWAIGLYTDLWEDEF